jgi:hypothetical protein
MMSRRILIFSRDPGGANAVAQLIEPLRLLGNHVAVYGKDAALDVYRKLKIDCADIGSTMPSLTEEGASRFVQALQPDLILTGTSSEDFTERFLWKAAEHARIPSFAVLDQWTNYRLRLIPEQTELATATQLILPSFLFVMDEFARSEMASLGIAPARLVVTGQPFFDYVREAGYRITSVQIRELRAQLSGGQNGLVLVFASQPIASLHRQNGIPVDYWGYTETTVLKSVMACLTKLTQELQVVVTLIIRLHPKDRDDAYDNVLRTCPRSVRPVFDREIDSSLLLKAADLVIGMFSMILLEAAILETPFFSVQIGLKRENPLILDRIGVVRSILTEEELEQQLLRILRGEKQTDSDPKFQFGATQKIVEFLSKYL